MTTSPDTLPDSPDSHDTERTPTARIVFWAVVAVVVLAGIALYFKYSGALAPLLGQTS